MLALLAAVTFGSFLVAMTFYYRQFDNKRKKTK